MRLFIQPISTETDHVTSNSSAAVVFVYAVKKIEGHHSARSLANFGSSSAVHTSLLTFKVESSFDHTNFGGYASAHEFHSEKHLEQEKEGISGASALHSFSDDISADTTGEKLDIAEFQRTILEELAYQRHELAAQRVEIAAQRALLEQLVAHGDPPPTNAVSKKMNTEISREKVQCKLVPKYRHYGTLAVVRVPVEE